MCFAAAPLVFMAISAAASIANSYNAAKAKNAAAESQAMIDEQGAIITRDEGKYAQGQATREASQLRLQSGVQTGARRAVTGASGVVVDSGSSLDVILDMAEAGERKAVGVIQNGDADTWRAENKARGYEGSAALKRAGKVNPNAVALQAGIEAAASASSKFAGGFG